MVIEMNTITKVNTDVWTIVERELEREPEVVSDTYVTSYTNISCVEFSVIEQTIETTSTTDTKIPIPRTFVLPRHRSVEWVNPIVSNDSTKTIAFWEVNSYIKEVRFA